MTWIAEVTKKYRDPSNFNIVAEITFTNGEETRVDRIAAVDLSDETIAEHVRKRIKNVLEVGDAALEALTLGGVVPAADPEVDAKQVALQEANVAFQKAVQAAQVKALKDAEAQTAYDNLVAAQDDLTSDKKVDA